MVFGHGHTYTYGGGERERERERERMITHSSVEQFDGHFNIRPFTLGHPRALEPLHTSQCSGHALGGGGDFLLGKDATLWSSLSQAEHLQANLHLAADDEHPGPHPVELVALSSTIRLGAGLSCWLLNYLWFQLSQCTLCPSMVHGLTQRAEMPSAGSAADSTVDAIIDA